MKNSLLLLTGLVTVVLIAAAIIGLQKHYEGAIARKDAEISGLKESLNALSVREAESQARLAAADEESKRLQARFTELENRPAHPPRPEATAQPAAAENKPADSTPAKPASDKMRRFARGILKVYGQGGDHQAFQKDQELQIIFMEFMAEMMKLTTKHNLKLNMFSGDSSDICKAYAIPEMRQWFCEVGAALFEELGVPLSQEQLKAVDGLMAQTGQETAKIDELQLPLLEKTIMLHRLNIKQSDEFCRTLTAGQNDKVSYDVVLVAMTGHDTCDSLFSADTASGNKSAEQCATDLVNNRWQRVFGLNDAEEESIKYLADMYMSEYAACKNSAETEYGKEFMDYYLTRWSGDYTKWYEARKEYFKTAANRRKKDALDLRFAEIQLKSQQNVLSALPGGAERQKEQSRTLLQFPYLGN